VNGKFLCLCKMSHRYALCFFILLSHQIFKRTLFSFDIVTCFVCCVFIIRGFTQFFVYFIYLLLNSLYHKISTFEIGEEQRRMTVKIKLKNSALD